MGHPNHGNQSGAKHGWASRGALGGRARGLARGGDGLLDGGLDGIDRGQLLVQGEDRRKEVATALDALDYLGSGEFELCRVSGLQTAADFGPGYGSGGRGVRTGTQGVHADGGFVHVVLAPVDQNLALAEAFVYVTDDQLGVFVFEVKGELVGEGLGFAVPDARVERDVDLQALGAGGLGKAAQSEVGESIAHPDGDLAALDDVGGFAGIEIKDDVGGVRHGRGVGERGVQLQRCQVGGPDQRGKVLDDTVFHPAVIALTPDRGGGKPLGAMAGTVFLVEKHLVDPVGITLERERASGEMGDKDGSDANVVIDNLPLGKACLRVKNLIEVAEREATALDVDNGFTARHT